MKKIFTFAFSTLLGLTAAAQGVYQFADPSFEDWDADNEPGKGWTLSPRLTLRPWAILSAT